MDFNRIKQNLRFRSSRSKNTSKRFPTHQLPKTADQQPCPVSQQQEQLLQNQEPVRSAKRKTKPPTKKPGPPKASNEKPAPPTAPAEETVSLPPTPQPSSQGQEVSQLRQYQDPTPVASPTNISRSSSASNYDLRPATPAGSLAPTAPLSLESLTELLYSSGYLDTLTSDPQLLHQFTTFLARYQPSIAPLIPQYLATQKVIKAIAYANSVAISAADKGSKDGKEEAAVLSAAFKARSDELYNSLLNRALPAWISYSVVKTSTICLTAEITGQHSSPFTRDLIGGLGEVFCLTDPKKQDNPIIYASSHFYTLTGYSKDDVIGHNCRFLQGARTQRESVTRLTDAIKRGDEICETLLNYTRDGKPFVNVLLLAPDRKSVV